MPFPTVIRIGKEKRSPNFLRETGNWKHMREAEQGPPSQGHHLNSGLEDDRRRQGRKVPRGILPDKDRRPGPRWPTVQETNQHDEWRAAVGLPIGDGVTERNWAAGAICVS